MYTAKQALWAVGFTTLGCAAASAQTAGYSLTILDSAIPDSTHRCVALAISGDGSVVGGGDTSGRLSEKP